MQMSREELIELVNKIIILDVKSEKEVGELLDRFGLNVPHPAPSDLIYYAELSPEEIVDKALSYKPIQL